MKKVLIAIMIAMTLVGCHQNTSQKDEKKTEAVETFDSPEALFHAVEDAVFVQHDAQRSIKLVDKLVADYPTFEQTPVALFMLANFIYDEQLHDLDKARATYQQIVDNYPDSPFANDAAISITQLGMTPDELVRMFEEASSSEDASSVGNNQ